MRIVEDCMLIEQSNRAEMALGANSQSSHQIALVDVASAD